jgi:hypothetical protein
MGILRAFHNVFAFLGRIFGKDAEQKIEDLLIKKLLPIALVAVGKAEELVGASGKDKQAQAFSDIRAALGSAGKDIRDSLINLAIELALAKLQGVFGGN